MEVKRLNYEINSSTLAIVPHDDEKTKILEGDREYIIDGTPYEVMEHSCEYFGSSMEGRLKGSKNILGSIYKAPIIVEEYRGLVFFPTRSITSDKDNVWLSLKNIVSYLQEGNKTRLYFKDGYDLLVDIPYSSFENQILRATRLDSVMRQRKTEEKMN